ncbi:MAG: YaeQ family protein [Gammaproteobacteria bacterium]|nr:YaeQ family protein [Gammaproteobacteria bacterium]
MAIKPTIYKMRISLSDLNRNYYDTLNLTLAQHPSETIERMMVRVLAYCINAEENLAFSKGLSEVDEPDIWKHSLDDQILLWIDVGEPAVDRIKKAGHIAKAVKVYSFNSKSDVWWSQVQNKMKMLPASVFKFEWDEIQALAALVERTMDMSISITGDSAYVATERGECEVGWEVLQEAS